MKKSKKNDKNQERLEEAVYKFKFTKEQNRDLQTAFEIQPFLVSCASVFSLCFTLRQFFMDCKYFFSCLISGCFIFLSVFKPP